ncbi:MAG: type II toxin-antitoxin system PemK/MazF family toxin [Myxococcota bacterium]
MKRGTLCWVNLEPSHPPEFGKTRPGVVVSNSEQNAVLETVVIVPVSSQSPEIWPLRLAIHMPQGKKSFAVLPGIRQVSKRRITQTVGLLSLSELERLDEALGVYLQD